MTTDRVFGSCLPVCLAMLLSVVNAHPATYTAATANLSDIQAKINLTVDADTVVVPSGNLGWSTNLYITNDIALIGNGIGSTIITNSASSANAITWIVNSSGKAIISGFEFRGGAAASPDTGLLILSGTCFMFRGCSNSFYYPNNRVVQEHGWINGVWDHNGGDFLFKQFAEVWHDGYGGGSFGDKSWADPDFEGTTNGMYFEDNAFREHYTSTPGAIDMMGGARCFVRNNTFSNCNVTTHGTDSTGRQRSVRILDSYNNTFINTSGSSSTAGQYRGGSGIVCSNTYTGPDWAFGMSLTCYRELGAFSHWGAANGTNGYDTNFATIYATGTHTGANGASVLTDGTKTWNVNGWTTNILWNVTKNKSAKIDSNTGTTVTYSLLYNSVAGGANMSFDTGDTYQIMSVYPALDQPGRGQQATPFTLNSDPATPVGNTEALDPIYSWSNTVNGVVGMNVNSSYPSVLSGRDYFPNVIKPGAAFLVYPHPLVSGGITPTPSKRIARVNNLKVGKAKIGP